MSEARNYSAGTRAALPMLSQGKCYFPGCQAPILCFVEDSSKNIAPEPHIDYHIAHIKDASTGNRYDPSMTDGERASFSNLILLCKPHHDLVDKTHPERYSSRELERWKSERESRFRPGLANLGVLESSELESLLLDAARREQHEEAMRILETTDINDSARLIQGLGSAVGSIPSSEVEEIIEFLRRIGQLGWVRPDWNAVKDSMLTQVGILRSALDQLPPVLATFTSVISEANGYKRLDSFHSTPSLRRALVDEKIDDDFAVEIRVKLRSLIVNRSVAQTLLHRLLGFNRDWGSEPLESHWAAPMGEIEGSRLWNFEFFIPDYGFSFRAHATVNTVDLYGLREGWGQPMPEPLSTELIDPLFWWLALVPCAMRYVVNDAMNIGMHSKDYSDRLDVISTLGSPQRYMVGLA